jgi:4'-phosphopantetheinyl transferase
MNLNPHDVHIWSATIDEKYHTLLTNSYLSDDEKERGERFLYDIDAYIYIVKHNLLRIILGRYLNCNPKEILYKYNLYQKPYILHPSINIQFNISSSSNRFIAAFCLHQAVGVDVELIRKIENIKQLTSDYFTVNEAGSVIIHSDFMLETEFFNIWSMKEALIKAIGKGLAMDINTFDILSMNPITFNGQQWYITRLNIFDDCTTALAINHPSIKLKYFNTDDLLD